MKDIHESVAVGAFCVAVGATSLRRQLLRFALSGSALEERSFLYNLSHNPFDPAMGDAVLEVTKFEHLRYFLFELKTDFNEGVLAERAKLLEKQFSLTTDAYQLLDEFPLARTAHLFGWLQEPRTERRMARLLCFKDYWGAVLNLTHSGTVPVPAAEQVMECAENPEKGMPFEMLIAYVRRLNEGAPEGSKARRGAECFALVFMGYQAYMLTESQLLQKALEMTSPKRDRSR